MKNIGILTSGGDAPGMNACIRAAVRVALANNLEFFGIRWGYAGLIRGDIISLNRRAVANIIHQGGTILGTACSDELSQHLEENYKRGKRSAIVVVAETKQPGESFHIAQGVKDKTGFDSRICILGHIQRGGSPTARDRVLASKLGVAAVRALVEGKETYMIGDIKGEITYTQLKDTWEKKKHLNSNLEELTKLLFE